MNARERAEVRRTLGMNRAMPGSLATIGVDGLDVGLREKEGTEILEVRGYEDGESPLPEQRSLFRREADRLARGFFEERCESVRDYEFQWDGILVFARQYRRAQ